MFSCVRARGEIKHPQQMISHQRGDRLVLEFYWGFAGQICYLIDIALALRRILSHANTALAAPFPALCGLFQRSRHTPFFLLFVCVVSDSQFCSKVVFWDRDVNTDSWNEWSQAGQAELRWPLQPLRWCFDANLQYCCRLNNTPWLS